MRVNISTVGVCKKAPNQIKFRIRFIDSAQTHDEVVDAGARNVLSFQAFLESLNIDIDLFKTDSYSVRPVNKTVEKRDSVNNRLYTESVFSHYECDQLFELIIPYDKKILFSIINGISEMKNPPKCEFVFCLTSASELELKDEALSLAIDLAWEKAEFYKSCIDRHTMVSDIVCESISSRNPFYSYDDLMSNPSLQSQTTVKAKRSSNNIDAASNSLTPQDVMVSVSIDTTFLIQ